MKRGGSRWGAKVGAMLGALLVGVGCERQEGDPAGSEVEKETRPEELTTAPDPVGLVSESVPKPGPEEEGDAETGGDARPAPQPVRVKEPWTVAEAGFAARLPRDVEFYADTRRLSWLWGWLGRSGAMEELEKLLAGPGGKDLVPEELAEAIRTGSKIAPLLLGDEAFVAGRGLAWSWEAAVGINEWMNHAMGEALTKGIVSGDIDSFLTDEAFSMGMLEGAARWLEENLEKVEGDPPVALYAGGRVANERRAEVLEWVKKLLAKAAADSEKLEAIGFERGGASWSGFEIGIEQFEGFDPEEEAPEGIEAEVWEKMLEQMAEWSLVVVCAEVDEYVVLAVGNGKESIVLAESPDRSLASGEGFKFFERYDVKRLFGTVWASRKLVEVMHRGSGNRSFFEGVEKGLEESPGLRRGEAMVKALGEFNGHWKARRVGVAHEWVGAVLLEDGLRAETRGGWDAAGLDLETPLKFAKAFAGLDEEPFIRAHWKEKAEHIQRGHQQVEAGLRFLKLVGGEAMQYLGESAEKDGEEELVERFGRWKRDLTKGIEDIAKGYTEHFSKAFGEESAFVMDLRGEMIPAFGVDEEVLEKGRIPRAAFVRPVVKREALGESWEIWNRALTNLFGIVAEGMEQPIPFPDTMTAEKDDLRTYFFPFPFATDDFLPSVSVSDELFILGSSKTLSEGLYEASSKAEGGALEAGLWVEVRTEGLWDFCEAWLAVYEERRKAGEEIEKSRKQLEEGSREERKPERPRLSEAEAEIPKGEVENPLLKELSGEKEEEGPKIEDTPGSAPDEVELEEPVEGMPAEALAAEEVEEEEWEVEGPGSLRGREFLELVPTPESLRSMLAKARQFRGLHYRRWSEDGVPRSSLRVDWKEE